jgi:hypothetical protein
MVNKIVWIVYDHSKGAMGSRKMKHFALKHPSKGTILSILFNDFS